MNGKEKQTVMTDLDRQRRQCTKGSVVALAGEGGTRYVKVAEVRKVNTGMGAIARWVTVGFTDEYGEYHNVSEVLL